MQSVPDFSFLTELSVTSERMQASLQEAYEFAVRAERNIEVNPERYCFSVRESARFLTRAYGTGNGLPTPDSYGLDNYATDREYQDHLSEDLISQLNYLRRYTSLSRGKASADTQVNLINYLHSYAKGIYRELGGKARPSDRKISLPSATPVREHFSQSPDKQKVDQLIDELLNEIIPDGVAAEQTARETQALQQSCMDEMGGQIRDIRTQIDAFYKMLSDRADQRDDRVRQGLNALRKELDQRLQKMTQDTVNQNDAQTRSLRQFKELLDQVLAAQNRQALSQDDLMARLSSLEEKLDQIEKKNEASRNDMQRFAKEMAQSVANFYQNNREPLEQLGESVKEIGVGLLRAGKSCLQTAAAFAQKAGAAAERISQETRQQADQLVQEAKKRAGQATAEASRQTPERETDRGRHMPQEPSGTAFAGIGVLQRLRDLLKKRDLEKWCKKLSVAEPLPFHRTWNAFCVTGLILYFLLFYVLVSDHVLSFPALAARLTACLWYALSFFLFLAGRLSLYFMQIRIAAGLLDRFLRGLPFLHLPFWKKTARNLVLAVVLYLLTRYCYEHFYLIARNGFGWKQLFLASGSGEIRQMVSWCLSVWGSR